MGEEVNKGCRDVSVNNVHSAFGCSHRFHSKSIVSVLTHSVSGSKANLAILVKMERLYLLLPNHIYIFIEMLHLQSC